MNEEMKAEMAEMDSIPDHLAVSEDESVDEDVPIDIGKKIKTKAYKQTISQDISNIDTYETRKKLIQQNGDLSMRLYMKLISNSLISSLRILSENVKIIKTKHNLYQVM